jgi:class 3 adenylate cyclase
MKEEDDYFGSVVVMAARIIDESAGGQILVSDLLRQVADGPPIPNMSTRILGGGP